MPIEVLSIYASGDWWSASGGAGQFGVSTRLGPGSWLARPSIRIGTVFNAEDSGLTVGLGLRVGRRYGGLISADVGEDRGGYFAVVHIGG